MPGAPIHGPLPSFSHRLQQQPRGLDARLEGADPVVAQSAETKIIHNCGQQCLRIIATMLQQGMQIPSAVRHPIEVSGHQGRLWNSQKHGAPSAQEDVQELKGEVHRHSAHFVGPSFPRVAPFHHIVPNSGGITGVLQPESTGTIAGSSTLSPARLLWPAPKLAHVLRDVDYTGAPGRPSRHACAYSQPRSPEWAHRSDPR